MQAQFGKTVLGAVRLREAEEHRKEAEKIKKEIEQETSKEKKKELKIEQKKEQYNAKTLKNSRWSILTNKSKLSDLVNESLQTILNNHNDLSICYSFKEEMIDIFD